MEEIVKGNNFVEAIEGMDPEQLQFNQRMIAFLRFLGVEPKDLEVLPEVLKTYRERNAMINQNFKEVALQEDSLRQELDEIKKATMGEKSVYGGLYEPPKRMGR